MRLAAVVMALVVVGCDLERAKQPTETKAEAKAAETKPTETKAEIRPNETPVVVRPQEVAIFGKADTELDLSNEAFRAWARSMNGKRIQVEGVLVERPGEDWLRPTPNDSRATHYAGEWMVRTQPVNNKNRRVKLPIRLAVNDRNGVLAAEVNQGGQHYIGYVVGRVYFSEGEFYIDDVVLDVKGFKDQLTITPSAVRPRR